MSQIFDAEEPKDPWALPSPKHTWENSHDDDIPDPQEEPAMSPPGTTSTSTSIAAPVPVSAPAPGNGLHNSIWDEEVPVLSDPLMDGDKDVDVGNNNHTTGNTAFHHNTSEASADFLAWSNAIRSQFSANSKDIVTITEIPEKEGLLFKHTNYLVAHLIPLPDTDATNDRKVIRRYSDFVWLMEVLLKKYTFRLIPELPPKKIASVSDPTFLERRRKGLTRFINQIMKHPILSKDQLVLMFLTVPTDLSSWRRQAQYDTTEEFKDQKISPSFLVMWDENLEKLWQDAEFQLKDSIETWTKLTILIERFSKRSQQFAADNERFTNLLRNFRSSNTAIYSVEASSISRINEDLKAVEKHMDDSKNLLIDESNNSEFAILEDFKSHSDYLISLKTLFDRYERLGVNQIDQLSKRVESNTNKLQDLNGKPDVKGFEIDKLNEAITRDKKEIAQQTNRDWLIKQSLLTEFVMFQETQYQITKIFQEWIADKLKYSELCSNNWGHLLHALQDMPLSRND